MALSDMLSGNKVHLVIAIVAVVLVGYLVMTYMDNNNKQQSMEHFYSDVMPETAANPGMQMPPTQEYSVDASDGIQNSEQPKGLGDTEGTMLNQLPAECYPKDILSSADLLPRDADSAWAQVAPSGQGSLQDKNFLAAGFHVGINTVGQTLRNANRQLRSEPPNPQSKVSPWNQTTIDADINRRPLEIGGCA
jgi:hypothetical protein